jgi:hypothetical protein
MTPPLAAVSSEHSLAGKGSAAGPAEMLGVPQIAANAERNMPEIR